ncbi:histidinol-phosphate transaminase [Allohahella marinimesophila]|uniref:Histidinol-phosphate aminotransferase n=1 Tax=Allohahella marinimesophila TaxID=1054972 RepID=A0ABP7P333_9GAMM
MQFDPNELVNEAIQQLQPYVPGKPEETLRRELGLEKIIKLASNETPLRLSDAVWERSAAALRDIMRYPDGSGFDLKRKLADRLGVTPDMITLGNGSNDVLLILAQAFAGPGREVLFSQYAFAVYPIAAATVGATAVVVPARDYAHDLMAIQEAITPHTRLIYLANPNNPTGTGFSDDDFLHFMEMAPLHCLVVLDEAYFEFAGHQSGIGLLTRFPNLVVTRTFSKAFGMAGLRLGYSVSSPQVAEILNRVRQPFNVNSVALATALAVLDDPNYVRDVVELNALGLKQLQAGLKTLDLACLPTEANFVTFHAGPKAGAIYDALLREGVIVRPLAGYDMPEYLRVSVGLDSENERFLSVLGDILKSQA